METFLVISSVLLWVVVAFNLLLTLAIVRKINAGSQVGQSGLKPGTPVPVFSAQTLKGETITQANIAGKPTLFLFISPDCGPCKDALPKYKELYPKARLGGVEMVLVSISDHERTQTMIEQFALSQPVWVAPMDSNSFMKDFEITGTPGFTLVNAQGKIQSAGFPTLEWGEFRKLVESWEKAAARSDSGA